MGGRIVFLIVSALSLLAGGCAPAFTERARNGITFFCPGAGNIDFGDVGVRAGLKRAGYPGQVATLTWTVSLNPAFDQAFRFNAHLGAQRLARAIEQYHDEYSNGAVNLIGLSAGTGVAIWALEDLREGCQVDNVVLLASSLSHDYDVSAALRHVRGNIYNYWSTEDRVLTVLMKGFGTIDGKPVDGAGAVGLHSPSGGGRIVNVQWRPEFRQYGYVGGHTDATSPRFVEAYIAAHISGAHSAWRLERTPATHLATDLPGGTGD